ncbi:MAG: hypothetical protein D6768_05450 [Chloroflexi bacterium]|nr:MAG: hypothetical protein D6768_05450 [Chloroflexota bacterium]
MSQPNPELRELFEADQAERKNHPPFGTPEYESLRRRDAARREQVRQIIAAGQAVAPEDFYFAALVLHHGGTLDEVWQAHTLAQKSADRGYRPARWLTAATLDRWLMMQGKPQKYGTQIVPDGRRQRVWPVDPATTDAERAALDVRPLALQHRRAAELSRTEPMPDMSRAPVWLTQAIARGLLPDTDDTDD